MVGEPVIERWGRREIMANTFFVLANDKNNFFNTSSDGFFYGILCRGTINNEQEFFGHGFGDGQEACPKAGGRDYRFSHFWCHTDSL